MFPPLPLSLRVARRNTIKNVEAESLGAAESDSSSLAVPRQGRLPYTSNYVIPSDTSFSARSLDLGSLRRVAANKGEEKLNAGATLCTGQGVSRTKGLMKSPSTAQFLVQILFSPFLII